MSGSQDFWMQRALSLAKRGRFTVSPNPMVGACVVRNGTLCAEGYHEQYGSDHAEVVALGKAKRKSRNATLFVTLEPCSTWGKTPPCVAAIVRAGIRRVVIGSLDPNPKNHGVGVRALKKEGIEVVSGVLAREVGKQNESFFKYIRTKLPFVTLKMAQSLDGKIATRDGHSRWISSPASRDFVHRLRSEQDAILIGKNTLLADNPKLALNLKIKNKKADKPWRIILDPDFEVPRSARIFQGGQLTFVAIAEKNLKRVSRNLKPGNAFVFLPLPQNKDGRLDLKVLLKKIAGLGVAKLLVEGGGELAWSLFHEGLIDKAYWIVAPKILGGRKSKTSVEGDGVRFPEDAIPCKINRVMPCGDDWIFESRFK